MTVCIVAADPLSKNLLATVVILLLPFQTSHAIYLQFLQVTKKDLMTQAIGRLTGSLKSYISRRASSLEVIAIDVMANGRIAEGYSSWVHCLLHAKNKTKDVEIYYIVMTEGRMDW